jgi:hypothetical protein
MIFSSTHPNITISETNNSSINFIYVCFPLRESLYGRFLNHIWTYIDLTIYSFLPFFTMVICSALILVKVNKKKPGFLDPKTDRLNKRTMARKAKRNKNLITMLFVTNSYFIMCSLPYCILNINLDYFKTLHNFGSFILAVNVLSYSHNAINFVFYVIFCERYREVLVKFFQTKIKWRMQTQETTLRSSQQSKFISDKFVKQTCNRHELKLIKRNIGHNVVDIQPLDAITPVPPGVSYLLHS